MPAASFSAIRLAAFDELLLTTTGMPRLARDLQYTMNSFLTARHREDKATSSYIVVF